ncbi:A24 family peptidase [Halomonas maura]|uniref:A24 family peptidase n=1 Tax=Halomonas maura TaxID=117606 RepID=UPI0025B43413|nr:prepilin peptidase [Halomonas maura]MDN3558272.1 prepilin peptidase [Halomonas maura]
MSALLLLVGVAMIWDIRQRRIPNRFVVVGAALGILCQFLAQGPGGVPAAFLGLLAGMAILMPGYLLGFTGAGDVKLMGAVGSFVGPVSALAVGCFSLLAGGLVALCIACLSARSASPWQRYGLMARTLVTTGRPIYIAPRDGEAMGQRFPFGIAIFLGTSAWLGWQWVH